MQSITKNLRCLLCNNIAFSCEKQFILGLLEDCREQLILENATYSESIDEEMIVVKTQRGVCKNCRKGCLRCRKCNYCHFLKNTNCNVYQCLLCKSENCLKCGQGWELYLNEPQKHCSQCQLKIQMVQNLIAYMVLIIVTPIVPFILFFYLFFTENGSTNFINKWFKYATLILVCVIFPVAYVCAMIAFIVYKIGNYDYFVQQLQYVGFIKK